MTTIDARTRHLGGTTTLDAGSGSTTSCRDLLRDTGALGARGVELLGLSTLGFEVDGTVAHLAVVDGALARSRGSADDGPVVALDAAAFSDLCQDVASTFGLVLAGRVQMRAGRAPTSSWRGSRCCVPRSTRGRSTSPGSIEFRTATGRARPATGPSASTTRARTSATSSPKPATCTSKACSPKPRWPRCRPSSTTPWPRRRRTTARRGGRATDEGWYPSRILGFNLKSPTLQELLDVRPLPRASASFTDDAMVQRPPRQGDSAEGLLKKVGVVEGISDVSWHKDCSLGGHSRRCCGLTVGISVTGAEQRSGELGVVAGSTAPTCSTSTCVPTSISRASRSRRAPAT